MFSLHSFCYKFFLICRLWQIIFLNGYRPFDEYSDLVENYLRPMNDAAGKARSNTSSVTRTHLFPIFSAEFASLIITILQYYSKAYPSIRRIVSSLSPYFILRFSSLLGSLLVDYFIFRIATLWRIKPNLVLFLFSSSHIPWIFFTFSRSCLLESILFSLILYFVVSSMTSDEERSNLHPVTHGNERYGHGNFHGKYSGKDNYDSTGNAFVLGVVFSCGISNRLNFAVFALAPLIQWILACEYTGLSGFCSQFCRKMWKFLFGVFIILLFIALIDSTAAGLFHLERLHFGDILDRRAMLYLWRNNLTFASWNSLLAELTFSRVAHQKIHPWYNHLFNIALMFGVFGICGLLYFLQCFRLEILFNVHRINSKYWFLLSSFIVPLISLCIYPTKTPEDLCPLLIPLILIVVIRISQYSVRLRSRLILAWLTWNLFGLFYYGYLYNGALVTSISTLEDIRMTQRTMDNTTYAYHFYATDQPPPISWFSSLHSVHRDRLSNLTVFYYRKNEGQKFDRRLKNTKFKYDVSYVIVPATVSMCNFEQRLSLVKKYPWHYSPEAPPNIWYLFGCSMRKDGENDFQWRNTEGHSCADSRYETPCMENKWHQLYELLSLKVYRLT